MDLTPRILPVDRLVGLYNAMLACVWAAYLGRAPYVAALLVAHLVALTLPPLLRRAPALSPPVRVLRDLYPLLWLAAFWPELDLLHQLRVSPTLDAQVAALDLALFPVHGTHMNLTWMPAMPYAWLSEPMHFAYWAYYLLIFIPPVWFTVRGQVDALRKLVFGLMLTYLACYVVYIAYPVYGPGLTMPRYAGPLTELPLYRLVRASLSAGDSPGCAFPSSHVAGAVTIAYATWRSVPRAVGCLLWAEAVGVLVSTVYTQNHFPVDAVSGFVWALALQIAVVPAAARWLAPSQGTGVSGLGSFTPAPQEES